MHPHAYRLMAGLNRATLAPNDDRGHELEDDFGGDDFDEELDDEQAPDGDEELDDEFDEEHEDEEDGEINGRQQPSQRSSRGESRQARLSREARELRERLDRQERELEALRTGGHRQQPQGETPEQLNARLQAMEPVERIAEIQRLTTQNTQGMIQALQFQIADTNDQTKFNGLMARSPKLSKHAEEVERRLADYRSKGVNIPREDVLKHILGERAMGSATRTSTRATRQAEARREAQRGRPGGGRSDGGREGRTGGNDKSARDRRLENLKI